MSIEQEILAFSDPDFIGQIISVDTSHVYISAEKPEIVTKISVGTLIAIQGTTKFEYLIGTVDKISRTIRDDFSSENDNEQEIEFELIPQPSDLVRVILVGTYYEVKGNSKNLFKRGADSFPQIDRNCFVVSGSNLQRFMLLMVAGIDSSKRLELGHFVNDRSAISVADGNKFFQRHASILGSTGSGKSWCVAVLLEEASKLKNPNIIVFDMHGEYSPLTRGDNSIADGYHIAGPGDLDGSDRRCLYLPYWLLNREELLSILLDRSDQNAPNQASRFTEHIKSLKSNTLKKYKQDETIKTFTVDSPIPYEKDELVALLQKDDTQKGTGSKGQPIKGEWEGKLTRFISRLQTKLSDRRYGFMFNPPSDVMEYDWLSNQVLKLLSNIDSGKGIKIIDFSEVPSDILPIVTGTLARILYDVQFWMEPDKRFPFALLCDEAHLYLPVREEADVIENQSLKIFERIAKEGRKYGAALVVVSQRPSDVSRTILSQCNNFLVLRLTNDRDQAVVKRLVPDSMNAMTDILPLLDTGEAIILGDSILIPSRIKIKEPFLKPESATRNFWSDWNTHIPENNALVKAVESLRRQTRNTL